jgi:hypothetical protein
MSSDAFSAIFSVIVRRIALLNDPARRLPEMPTSFAMRARIAVERTTIN